MRFLLIDRIEAITKDTEITVIKNVALSEDYFDEHFPWNPIMPGSLLVEAMAQAGTALLEISKQYAVKAMPIMMDQIKFRHIVRPGDSLRVRMSVKSNRGSLVILAGEIVREENVVTRGSITFILKSAGELYPPQAKIIMANLYGRLLEGAQTHGFEQENNTHD